MMPKSRPSSMGTGMAATVHSAFFSRWYSSIVATSIRYTWSAPKTKIWSGSSSVTRLRFW